MNYRQELKARERMRKEYERISYERRHSSKPTTPKDVVDLYCANHPESHIITFVQEQIPEQNAQLFFEKFRELNGEHWIKFDTRSLFAIKDRIMNSSKI